MEIVGLLGERVRLVPAEAATHLENALRWLNDPAVAGSLERNFGVTRREEEEFFDRIGRNRETDLVWGIHDVVDGRHIGLIGLHAIHWRHRSATGGLVIGERSAWGQGCAPDAVRVRSRLAFEQLGLHRVEGHTINPAMCRVYEKSGYHREGTARAKLWRDGQWADAELFAILEVDHFQAMIGPDKPRDSY